MKLSIASAAALALFGLISCATNDGLQHDSLLITGKIEHVTAVAARPHSAGAYQPGVGGAMGGAIAGALMYIGGKPAYSNYTVRAADGTAQIISSEEAFEVGDCVSAFVAASKASNSYWQLGEVTMKRAQNCG